MPVVHSFPNVTPPARFDGVAWDEIIFHESAAAAGPYLPLSPMPLAAPVAPASPQEPPSYDLTVDDATLETGWYYAVFTDSMGNESPPSEPVLIAPDYSLPTVKDVAQKLLSRTRTKGGGLAYTFNDNTEPSGSHVEDLIYQARDHVYGKLPALTDPVDIRSASELIRLYTAIQIELTIYSEQVGTNKSAYNALKDLYDEGMAALIESVGGEGMSARDDTGDDQTETPHTPYYDFPETSIGDGIMP